MKLRNCHSSVAFFLYFSVAVLVFVTGQPTTDDIHEYDMSKLINMVRELRAEQVASVARIGKLMEHQLAASAGKIAKLEGQLAATSTAKPEASKLSRLTLHS